MTKLRTILLGTALVAANVAYEFLALSALARS